MAYRTVSLPHGPPQNADEAAVDFVGQRLDDALPLAERLDVLLKALMDQTPADVCNEEKLFFALAAALVGLGIRAHLSALQMAGIVQIIAEHSILAPEGEA